MNLSFIVGELLFIGLIFSAVLLGGDIYAFIDYPSLLIVLGGTFALTLTSFNPEEIKQAFSHAFDGEGTQEDFQKSSYIFQCMIRNLILTGAIGTVIGLVSMLQNLIDPGRIGPAMGKALLTFYYAVFFSAIGPVPFMYLIRKRLAEKV